MKIGIWIPSCLSKNVGGGFSYPEKLIKSIDNYKFPKDIEIVYFSLNNVKGLSYPVVNISTISFLKKLFKFSSTISRYLYHLDKLIIRSIGMGKLLKKSGIKLVVYTEQLVCVDPDFPFISMNWDIGHRSTYIFPEFVTSFSTREYFYDKVLPKSLLISCESEAGKEEILKLTNIGEHKIKIVPLFAGNVSQIKLSREETCNCLKEIGVEPNSYFYYPAQFWPHKNHYGLLKAFKLFIDNTKSDVKLVLSGSKRSNYKYILQLIEELGLSNNVVILGFVPNDTVYSLYKGAISLIMASHFGPTNMPPIEAMELGCPVACSDISGHREILGDAGVYFDSFNIESMYEALKYVYLNNSEMREKILKRNTTSCFKVENAMECLRDILLQAVVIRSNWD